MCDRGVWGECVWGGGSSVWCVCRSYVCGGGGGEGGVGWIGVRTGVERSGEERVHFIN